MQATFGLTNKREDIELQLLRERRVDLWARASLEREESRRKALESGEHSCYWIKSIKLVKMNYPKLVLELIF